MCRAWSHWHVYLRQQDNVRACKLAMKVRALLTCPPPSQAHAPPQLLARLDLLDAETHWLLSDFEHATAAARGALATFTACDDAVGCADAYGILASVHSSTGDLPQRDQCWSPR